MDRTWEWTEGDDQYSVELHGEELVWRALAYDERLGDFRTSLRRQTTAEFLDHGPGEYIPEKITREIAALLGLNDPPWLKPA